MNTFFITPSIQLTYIIMCTICEYCFLVFIYFSMHMIKMLPFVVIYYLGKSWNSSVQSVSQMAMVTKICNIYLNITPNVSTLCCYLTCLLCYLIFFIIFYSLTFQYPQYSVFHSQCSYSFKCRKNNLKSLHLQYELLTNIRINVSYVSQNA